MKKLILAFIVITISFIYTENANAQNIKLAQYEGKCGWVAVVPNTCTVKHDDDENLALMTKDGGYYYAVYPFTPSSTSKDDLADALAELSEIWEIDDDTWDQDNMETSTLRIFAAGGQTVDDGSSVVYGSIFSKKYDYGVYFIMNFTDKYTDAAMSTLEESTVNAN